MCGFTIHCCNKYVHVQWIKKITHTDLLKRQQNTLLEHSKHWLIPDIYIYPSVTKAHVRGMRSWWSRSQAWKSSRAFANRGASSTFACFIPVSFVQKDESLGLNIGLQCVWNLSTCKQIMKMYGWWGVCCVCIWSCDWSEKRQKECFLVSNQKWFVPIQAMLIQVNLTSMLQNTHKIISSHTSHHRMNKEQII